MRDPLLRAEGLSKSFPIRGGLLGRQVGAVRAVDGVDLHIDRGETVGIVGESGCGKSTLARMLMRLLEPTSGSLAFDGTELTGLSRRQMVPIRRDISMVFQDPYGSLNPRHTVGTIIGDPLRLQGNLSAKEIKTTVLEVIERVGLSPEQYGRYPAEFSGGQRQRIGIARAVVTRPKLVIADEPVSALDVSIQAQVLNLMADLQDEFGLSYAVIAHDLSMVRHVADRVVVMYLGRVVEEAPAAELYAEPWHPYTGALMSAVPLPDPDLERGRERVLLSGDLPSPANPPSGCVFRTRCPIATERCATEKPELRELRPGHRVACHFPTLAPAAAVTTPTSDTTPRTEKRVAR
jgi:peptide/nickel transport system ATP-binding protein